LVPLKDVSSLDIVMGEKLPEPRLMVSETDRIIHEERIE